MAQRDEKGLREKLLTGTEEIMAIVQKAFRGQKSVAGICRQRQISQLLFYGRRDQEQWRRGRDSNPRYQLSLVQSLSRRP